MRTQALPPSRLFALISVSALSLGVVTLASGCSDGTAGSEEDGNETTAASGTGDESGTSDSGDTSTGTSSTDEGPSDTSDDGNFIGDEGPDTADTSALGNLGDMCTIDDDCAEDLFCNGVSGFGAVCSECGSDADCDQGNCTFDGAYFICGDGSVGQMCETDEACGEGLYCAEVVDLGGLVNGNFCSECKDDSQCPEGQLCAPQVEFTNLMDASGQRTCIEPNTAPNDQLCDAEGAGDEQCEGYCTTADIRGQITLGVCGECETDVECGGGTCMPATIGAGGLSGSTCG